MPKFVTIFEKTENIHLIKDVGQIPYLMHTICGYDSTLVTYNNDTNYSYTNNEVLGLNLSFIPKIRIGRCSLSILWYLFFNAKKIDVLHMFHHKEKTYLNFLMYKWRNPQGIAFLKSDMGLNTIQEYEGFISKKRPKYFMRSLLFNKVIKSLDIVSIESKVGFDVIQEKYSKYQDKFLHMQNGINIKKMHSLVPVKNYDDKENLILCVGRIGAKEKNNEFLLDAIKHIELDTYKVVFIGPIEDSFQENIELFYKENQNLVEKVIFTGAIYDRVELYEWYAKSKIFCLTSIEESFGFVLIEAMAYGNYVVTTKISSAIEITGNQKLGSIISSENELISELSSLIKEDTKMKNLYLEIINKTIERYNSINIISFLDREIKKIFK